MTEEEWLTSSDPIAVLGEINPSRRERKLQLYMVACARAIGPGLLPPESRAAVEAKAGLLEGEVTQEQFTPTRLAAEEAGWGIGLDRGDAARAHFASVAVDIELIRPYPEHLVQHRPFLSVDLLHDVFGNPFRPIAFVPEWRTPTVVALAAGVYADRAFDRLAILADALEEAGCDSADVLAHCRGAGPHVRGCWVVDRVLGKG